MNNNNQSKESFTNFWTLVYEILCIHVCGDFCINSW